MKTLSKLNILFIVLIASTVLLSIAFLYYKAESRQIIKTRHEYLDAVSNLKLAQILSWKKNRTADAKFFPTIGQFIKYTDYFSKSENTAEAKLYFSRTLEQFTLNGYDENIIIADITGKIFFSVDSTVIEFDPDRIKEINNTIINDSVTFGDFYFDNKKNKSFINIISVIKDNSKSPIGVFIQQVDVEQSLISLIKKWPSPSKTAETLLFRVENKSVVYINELRHKKNSALKLKIPLSQTDVVTVKGALGERGTIEGKDYRGVEVLAELNPIPGTDWYMSSEIDKDEVFEELFFRAQILILLTLLLILLFATFALYFYKLQQSRIYKNLFQKQKELSEAQEEFRTALYSIGDGVITTDTKGNIRQMNSVAEKLTGWMEKDAKGTALSKVFKIVNEETGKPVSNPVDMVLEKGMVVGLANHTTLISKNGKQIPIADSGSPIKDSENNIRGVVLVFSDQTKERAKEKLLLESEERFRKAFTTSPDSVNINRMSDGLYITTNKGFEKLTGYSEEEISGKTSFEINIWADPADREKLIAGLKANGIVENLEARFRLKNGMVKDGLMSAVIIELNGEKHILSITRDISELKLAQQSIRNSEANLYSLINNRVESIWSIDKDYNYIVFNDFFQKSFFETFNKKLEKGLNALDSVTLDLKLFWKPKYDAALAGEKQVFEFSTPMNNQIRYFQIYLNPIITGGKITGVTALSTDITDKKIAEKVLLANQLQLQSVINSTPIVLFVLDKDAKFTLSEGKGLDALSLKPGEVVGLSALEVYKDYPDVCTSIRNCLKGETASIIHKVGNLIYDVNYTPLFDEEGRNNGLIGVAVDVTESKLAEQALFKSEERLRLSLKAANQGLYDLNIQTGEAIVNDEYALMLGFDPKTFNESNSYWIERLHPDESEITAKAYRDYIAGKTSEYKVEFRQRTKNDEWKWILSIGKIVEYDSSGKPLRMLGTHTDISNIKEAEAELLKLSQAIKQSPTSILITNPKGEIEYVNPKFTEITGYTIDEMLGQNPNILKSGHTTDIEYKKIWEEIISGKEWFGEFCNRKKNGELYWEAASISPIFNNKGEISNFVSVTQDITERKHLLAEIIGSEEKFRSIWENSVDAMRLVNAEGVILNVNNSYCSLFGLEKKDLIGNSINISYIITEKNSSLEGFKKRFNDKTILKKFETEILKKDGTKIWIELTNSFIEYENNISLLSIIRDISDRKNLITELTDAKVRAEEMNRLKAFFFANMSHELRTPFVGIMGFSEILSESLQNEEEKNMARQILKSSKRLTDTLNKILNVTRLEFDRIDLINKEFDVWQVLKNTQSLYSNSAKLNNTVITVTPENEKLPFKTDQRLLEEILNNLVSNAVKFTENGTIKISAQKEFDVDKENLIIKVKDNGIGIPKDKQHLVWYEFRQVSEGLNRSFEGTGLGLTITKKYVEILGGKITLESEVNAGSTFTIVLPINDIDIKTEDESAKTTIPIKQPVQNPDNKKYKVLYVEDDIIALNYISIVLRSLYEVSTAFSAKAALEQVNKTEYDVLMLDINLGKGMDGVELMQEIRKIENYKSIPIVAVTAYAAQSDKEEFLAKGFSHYISKPFTSSELKGLLNGILISSSDPN